MNFNMQNYQNTINILHLLKEFIKLKELKNNLFLRNNKL